MTTVQVELAHISDSAVVGLIEVVVWNECTIDTEMYNLIMVVLGSQISESGVSGPGIKRKALADGRR